MHMLSHSKSRILNKCTNCEYSTPTKRQLIIHFRTHTGEKPFNCEHCKKSFTSAQYLKLHQSVHNEDKEMYKCTFCSYSNNKKNFVRHLKIHTAGEKLYRCSQCEKSFSHSSYLKKHMFVHSSEREKPLKCTICNFSTLSDRSGDLQRHNMTHTAEKPFMCKQCEKSFRRKQPLSYTHLTLQTIYSV